jgi:two-component system, NtrC family, nitrogen regulation response regulator GlnG
VIAVATVWIVDDDASVRWVLEKALAGAGSRTRTFERVPDFFAALAQDQPDVVVTDIRMPDGDGLSLMKELSELGVSIPVIVITAHADLDSAVAAYRGGAFEYLPKPFDVDEAVALVERAARAAGQTAGDRRAERGVIPQIVGQAPAMQEVFRSIGKLARSSLTVLITGESGTGKELVARALHEHSPRADKPFVALNTTAIAAELLESELFGHERGAFTGADSRRTGRFEQANTGTLFLDEIGDMSPALQTRLLRVLAEREFYRVGGQVPIRVDVRVIAATNQDLEAGVASGAFREDLYHRLNVIHIRTPALRERREDVAPLVCNYLARAARELGIPPKAVTGEAMTLLENFDWPGNVRELINVCRRLTVSAPGREIQVADLGAALGAAAMSAEPVADWTSRLSRWATAELAAEAGQPLLARALPEFEKALIRVALARACGNRQEAARLLGWGRNTLARKIRELGL